jgi:hypothetical protein
LTLRTLAETPSLSHVTAMLGPSDSSIPLVPRRPTVATHRLRPPHAARPPTLRCQARSSLNALISPLISLINPSSRQPAINGAKAITAGRFPLPRPGVPLPGHYKRMRSTPPAITTLTSPSITCFRVRSAHSTERLLHRLFFTVARSCSTLRCPLVTPTFYKNRKICANRGAYKKCISNCSSYEKLSKNKSRIGCIAWHIIFF